MELRFIPSKLPKRGERFIGEGQSAFLSAVAFQLKIMSVNSLTWDLVAKPWGKKGFRLDGSVKGVVAQACIVTLAPVTERIEEIIDLRFVPADSLNGKPPQHGFEEDINFDATPEDEPESYEGDSFDAMPFVIEHLALGLNPYPRAADAVFTEMDMKAEETSALTRALEAWAAKKES